MTVGEMIKELAKYDFNQVVSFEIGGTVDDYEDFMHDQLGQEIEGSNYFGVTGTIDDVISGADGVYVTGEVER